MSHYDQNKPQEAYPFPATTAPVEGYPQGPYVAPPPAGYPMKDGEANPQNHHHSAQTQSRGDGFWKGCCAALCCCCVLDACF
ncbi:protein CYSTEINE-RICH TRANSMEMBRANE MODULE 6-like isoform X1 [Cornus florida]|uniref:protein CYSTEINE-RICH TRANSMEMBRANE MODULE 6-like isoform X1 n=1 Tax=Cornus florida TaxID=4283 RepID=UPI0028A1A625|nr:protein CYSTEINE-RICH TRANSMEMBRANE MODULE 6-like isoform X1 [Cornus florida]